MADHAWKHKYFSKFTWCGVCKEFLWGITTKQGYKCTRAAPIPPRFHSAFSALLASDISAICFNIIFYFVYYLIHIFLPLPFLLLQFLPTSALSPLFSIATTSIAPPSSSSYGLECKLVAHEGCRSKAKPCGSATLSGSSSNLTKSSSSSIKKSSSSHHGSQSLLPFCVSERNR